MPDSELIAAALAVRSTKNLRPMTQRQMRDLESAKPADVEDAVVLVFRPETELGLRLLVEQVRDWIRREAEKAKVEVKPTRGRPRKAA